MILETYQKQPFHVIAMTPRGTIGLFFVHIAQITSFPYSLFSEQLRNFFLELESPYSILHERQVESWA